MFIQLFPSSKPEKYSDYVFNSLIADNSDFISFTEFLLVISVLSDKELSRRLALAFKIISISDDYKINARELERIINIIANLKSIHNERKVDEIANNMAVTIFKKLNRDYDRFLTEDEFVDGCINEPSFISLLIQE